jgi:hypothetical protein
MSSREQVEQPATAQTTATPGSPTSRRLSLGGGNDGHGGQIFKVPPSPPEHLLSIISLLLSFSAVVGLCGFG